MNVPLNSCLGQGSWALRSGSRSISGSKRLREIELGLNHFEDQIEFFKAKSIESNKKAYTFSIKNDLTNTSQNRGILVEAANRIRLIDEQLNKIEDLEIIGPNPKIDPNRASLATFYVKKIHSNDIAEILDSKGICIRSGHHCCQPLHLSLIHI